MNNNATKEKKTVGTSYKTCYINTLHWITTAALRDFSQFSQIIQYITTNLKKIRNFIFLIYGLTSRKIGLQSMN